MPETYIYRGNGRDLRLTKHTATAYTGGTPGSHGDHDGAGDPYTIFNVTGVVSVIDYVGVANVALSGSGAQIDIGTPGNIDIFSPTILADADTWVEGTCWNGLDAPSSGGLVSGGLSKVSAWQNMGIILDGAIANEATIIETLTVANITAGQVDWYILWFPISDNGFISSA